MTYEEAIKVIETYLLERFENGVPSEALKLAIEALQKQVPMKGNKTITYIRHCPKCKCVLSSSFKYCDECGQRIDWSNEE